MTVVFFDGYCGLCDRLVRFLLVRDTQARLRFAPLQGTLAQQVLTDRGYDATKLDTVYVIAGWKTGNERVLQRWRAVMHALAQLGGGWRLLARIGSLVPPAVGNGLYAGVARIRYRVFGRFEACALPPPEFRTRFVERSED